MTTTIKIDESTIKMAKQIKRIDEEIKNMDEDQPLGQVSRTNTLLKHRALLIEAIGVIISNELKDLPWIE